MSRQAPSAPLMTTLLPSKALIAGARNTQLIYVAAKLGLADVLHEGPRNADDIAAELGVNAPTLTRVLHGLVNRWMVTEEGAGTSP